MVRLKNETEEILFSETESCESLIEETHTNHKKELNLKLPNREKPFHLSHPLFLVKTVAEM